MVSSERVSYHDLFTNVWVMLETRPKCMSDVNKAKMWVMWWTRPKCDWCHEQGQNVWVMWTRPKCVRDVNKAKICEWYHEQDQNVSDVMSKAKMCGKNIKYLASQSFLRLIHSVMSKPTWLHPEELKFKAESISLDNFRFLLYCNRFLLDIDK